MNRRGQRRHENLEPGALRVTMVPFATAQAPVEAASDASIAAPTIDASTGLSPTESRA